MGTVDGVEGIGDVNGYNGVIGAGSAIVSMHLNIFSMADLCDMPYWWAPKCWVIAY